MKDDMNELKKRALSIVDIYLDLNKITEREADILRNAITTDRPKGEWKLIRVADHCGIHSSFVCPFCNYEREYRKKNFCEECGADLRGAE